MAHEVVDERTLLEIAGRVQDAVAHARGMAHRIEAALLLPFATDAPPDAAKIEAGNIQGSLLGTERLLDDLDTTLERVLIRTDGGTKENAVPRA